MSVAEKIFDRLSEWRDLPDYQLERRVDIFFACYLPEIMKNGSHDIKEIIIPEFPIRKGALGLKPENLSFKIDYLAVTKDLKKVFFIELKTEAKSISKIQCGHMLTAKDVVGIKKLIDGILVLFKNTSEKRKYYHLLQMIEQLGLIRIPNSVQEIMKRKKLNGINQVLVRNNLMSIDEWYIATEPGIEICYILPKKSGELDPDIKQITFSDVMEVVSREHDELSTRFASALEKWIV